MIKPKKWTGKSIGMPGIYSGVSMEHYHSAEACIEPSISSSGLRTIFTKSPAHYWSTSVYNEKRVEAEETEALILGRAAHHLLFGQADFKKLFAVKPADLGGAKFHMNRLACQIWVADRQKEGKTVLNEVQLAHIVGMSESLAAEPLVRAGILNGSIEMSWFAKHQNTGIWLKARPDASPNDSLDFVDLKTTSSTDWHSLKRTIYDRGYYIQAGVLAILTELVLGQKINSFTLVFIESKPPYDVVVTTLKENDIARGIKAAEYGIAKFAECFKNNHWPGRSDGHADARYIELDEYAQKAIDERLGG